jgi:putative nucleotidyltransferase with HDIG domain
MRNTEAPSLPICATWVHELSTTLCKAMDAKDCTTSEHAYQTADIAAMIARNLKLNQRQIDLIHIGAHLHDIGKIGIPDSILKKPGPLTSHEWEIIKQHPVIGANIVKPISFFNKKNGIKDIVLHHHERYDGGGYPHALKGESIPLGARIVTLADAFSAMLQKRPYKNQLSFDQAVEEVFTNTYTQFCPHVVNAFCKILGLVEDYFNRQTLTGL